MLLNNQIILITGGAQGIGLECVKAYIANGARVAILDNNEQSLEKLLEMVGPAHLGICCDVANEKEVENAIQNTL